MTSSSSSSSSFRSCYYFLFFLFVTSSSSDVADVVDAFLITTRTVGQGGRHLLSLNKKDASSSSSSHFLNANQIVDHNDNNNSNTIIENIRLNKVFKTTYSRRKADKLISDGRVKVNGEIVEDMGRRVIPYEDEIRLDDKPYLGWEVHHGFTKLAMNHDGRNGKKNTNTVKKKQQQQQLQQYGEEYIKYWKPVGVTSTTDRNIKSPKNCFCKLKC